MNTITIYISVNKYSMKHTVYPRQKKHQKQQQSKQ